MTQFVFGKRDFTALIMPSLDYQVQDYSRNAIGDPKAAEIIATGTREQLFELIEHLRAPAEIYNDKHEIKWWGYIHEVEITWHDISYGISLDTMSNKIAVAYTENQFRSTTDYSSDTLSTGTYGTKEELLSRSEITTAEALQLRDTKLQALKYPIPKIDIQGGGQTEKATIRCRGWLDTLEWIHYSNDEGLEAYETLGTEDPGREIGEDDRPIFAQAFQISSDSSWTVTSIWIRLWKQGSPADNFQLALKSHSGGNPGATLASATLAGGSVPEQATWVEFVLSVPVALSLATTYWIHNSRSGAISASDFYIIGVNKDLGYLNGDAKMYNTNLSAWVDASHKGDQNFRVMGDTATTAQISTLITSAGQFFTGTRIINASGISTNAFRSGDRTALFELLKLLASGTTNDRRLLCRVTPARVLEVYEEPAQPMAATGAYALTGEGDLYTNYGGLAPNSDCTIAVWCNLSDVVPLSVDTSRISNPSLFFIEEAEYAVAEDNYRIIRARDQRDVFEIGGIE